MDTLRFLVTGASGQLGTYLLRHLASEKNVEVVGWAGSEAGTRFGTALRLVDLRQKDRVAAAFDEDWPDVIIHTAAICRVDICYSNPQLAEQVNVEGTRWLTELAARHRTRLVYVSSDMVFDGAKGNYSESDSPSPLSRYGRSKLAGERAALELAGTTVARVSLLFGPALNGRPSFFDQQAAALGTRQPLTLFTDEYRTPLSLITAASALVELARSEVTGVIHLGGPERMSRWEMGERLAQSLNLDPRPLRKGRQRDGKFPEARPADVSLDSTRWRTLFPHHPWPGWDEAVRELAMSVPGRKRG